MIESPLSRDDVQFAAASSSQQLSPKRWAILIIFCCLSCSNNVQWIIFSPVVRQIQEYFNCTATQVNWLPLIYNLIYLVGVFPVCALYENMGLRSGMLVGGVINVVCAALKVVAVYAAPYYWLLAVSQLFSGAGQLFVLSLPAMVSSTWFSEKERTFATACASNASNFGIAVGFLVCPALVNAAEKSQMGALFGHQAAICVAVLLAIYFFVDAKPPIPPSVTANTHNEAVEMIPTLKVLLRNVPFVLLCTAIGVGQSVFGGVCAVMAQVLEPFGVTEDQAGWIGFIGVITGIVCCTVVSMVIDRIRMYKFPLVGTFFVAMICMSLMVIILLYQPSHSIGASFGFLITSQTFQALTYPLAFEFVAELTHPAPESVSSGAVMWVNNALTFALTLTMSLVLGNNPSTTMAIDAWLICIVVTGLSCALCLMVREDRRRLALENKAGGLVSVS